MKYIKDDKELRSQLREQIYFLLKLTRDYDEGMKCNAKLLAAVIRNIVHDNLNSNPKTISLLTNLNNPNILFYDSSDDIDSDVLFQVLNIISLEIGSGGRGLIAPLDNVSEHKRNKKVDFNIWWEKPIYKDEKNSFSRKKIVLGVANKDGGTHIESELRGAYADLTRFNSWGFSVVKNDGTEEDLEGPELPTIRQIAHELLKTLRDAYPDEYFEAEPNNSIQLGNNAIYLYTQKNDFDKAEEYFKKSLSIEPYNSHNLGQYALFLQTVRKRYDIAEEYYLKALKINNNHSINLGNYAYFLDEVKQDFVKAKEYYLKALDIEPRQTNNLTNYANMLRNICMNFNEAEVYYKRALEAEPEHVNCICDYATFLYKYKKVEYDKVEELFEKALSFDPKHLATLSNYAIFLLRIKKDLDYAEELFLKAIEISPSNIIILRNYAFFLLLIRKDFIKAKTIFEKVLSIEPNNQLVRNHYNNILNNISS